MLEILSLSTLTALAKKGTGVTAREFRQAVLEAVKDGKLTKEEIDTLEKTREELGLPLEVLDAIRVQAYVTAFETATTDTDVTDDEWDELEQIQDYLGLKDADIAKTKKQLYRMRVLSEMRKGNMPIIDIPRMLLRPQERVYWSEAMNLQADDWKDSGNLIITNKRLVFKGGKKSISINLGQVLDVDNTGQFLRIHANRHPSLRLEYADEDNAPILDSILLFVLENAQNA
ncbi:hypothetical protein K8942_02995 [Candidatus Peribacteria bacterium]|nr:MAG: hypothetical protein K8942_02995 [Candidatus Peribacteria bacterium]